ncbi:hypothetical protein CRUP_014268 [Coryphaenoides rupestris]|nr:hypothetical protein CRUP_014268 [Coryphaenoides rupestris]
MNPLCGRCSRVVYPTEKVNCLDKDASAARHYPKTNFTCVADTPENIRLKQQSKMQSQVLYKEEFEKNKGKGFSAVADTPEMQRIKKTQDNVSNIKYHEEFEKSRMGGEAPSRQPTTPNSAGYQQPAASQNFHYDAAPEPVRQAAAAPPPSAGKRYRAVYDYAAADEDEGVQQIDEGWMYGRVERTGQRGMLPANYVEAI